MLHLCGEMVDTYIFEKQSNFYSRNISQILEKNHQGKDLYNVGAFKGSS